MSNSTESDASFAKSYAMERCNGNNFHLWKIRMRALLISKNYWNIVDGTDSKPALTGSNACVITKSRQ